MLFRSMVKTVHVYYEIHNFHQNNRHYVNSLSSDQLKGESISNSKANSDCEDAAFLREFGNFVN